MSKLETIVWRSERQIRGIQAQVQAGINQCVGGATVEIDYAVAKAMVEICQQARKIERNHESPE